MMPLTTFANGGSQFLEMVSSSDENKCFRVWILDVDRWGDTQQMRTLAEATPGVKHAVVHLTSRKGYPKLRRVPRHDISWLDARSRSMLGPPWPDAVFLAGRSAVSVALWIRRQNPSTRLVAFGRPLTPFHLFDLVVTNPAYFPPRRPNILCLKAPLHILHEERLHAARQKWQHRLKELPRPRIAVLVGGSSAPYRFAPEEAAHLGREVSRLARHNGGSLLVTTNKRVGSASAKALFDAISAPAFLHDCHGDEGNPYLAFLATADAIVVTMDSLSMMTEAACTPAQVFIYPLKKQGGILRHGINRIYDITMRSPWLAPLHALLRGIEAQGILLRQADRAMFANWLIQEGHARWFSPNAIVSIGDRRPPLRMQEELDKAVQRFLEILHDRT